MPATRATRVPSLASRAHGALLHHPVIGMTKARIAFSAGTAPSYSSGPPPACPLAAAPSSTLPPTARG